MNARRKSDQLMSDPVITKAPDFFVEIAATDAKIHAAQRLRYNVFVEELGGNGEMVDHVNAREQDRYDEHSRHLLLIDRKQSENSGVVGTYRLLSKSGASRCGGFYSESEFSLQPLLDSGRSLLELGRSCIHKDYRGGTAMYELWSGLAAYVTSREIDVLFGVASFHGNDLEPIKHALAYLHHNHLAPPDLRVSAVGEPARDLDLMPADQIDRRKAMLAMPALIKGYLRLGGFVGRGAWIDRSFNTTDVCMVLDIARMNKKQRALYDRNLPLT